MNLGSGDVNYALKANFPFYIEQKDQRATGGHLKSAVGEDGTATTGGQPGADNDIRVGVTQGRTYDKGMNAPSFINPSSEPLKASMDLQAKLEDGIRKLIHLAVADTANRATAESKSMDNQGLEAGLSYIGLVLEAAERQIAEFWAAYEERNPSQRNVATIKYPDRYSLKTDSDRIAEAQSLVKLMYAVPGQKVKRELAKNIVLALLGGKISVGDIQAIFDEIDKAPYATSDPTTIIAAVEAGLCGEKTGSMALGFNDDEHIQARADHAARAIRILQAQQKRRPIGHRDHRGHEPRSGYGETGRLRIDGLERGGADEQRRRGAGRPRSFGKSWRWARKRRRPAATPRSTTRRRRPCAARASTIKRNSHVGSQRNLAIVRVATWTYGGWSGGSALDTVVDEIGPGHFAAGSGSE